MRILVIATRHVGDVTSGADLRMISQIRPLLARHEFCLLHAAPRGDIPDAFRIDLVEIFSNRIRTVTEPVWDWRRVVRPPGPMAVPAHPLIWRRDVAAAVEAFRPDVLQAEMLQACLVIPPALRAQALAFGQDSFARFSATRSMAEVNSLKRQVFKIDTLSYRFFERIYRRFGACAFLSDEDIEAAGAQENGVLVKLGVDILPLDKLPDEVVLFFGGNLQYLPNRDGILEFVRRVFPILAGRHPGIRLIIAGRSPDAEILGLSSESIEVIANPQDLTAVLRRALVVICPVSWGSGQKNKILEAAAAGRPIVADPHMIEGSDFEAGHHLLTASTTEDWIAAISCLVSRSGERERLRKSAHAHVSESWSWQRSASVVESVYQRLANPMSS